MPERIGAGERRNSHLKRSCKENPENGAAAIGNKIVGHEKASPDPLAGVAPRVSQKTTKKSAAIAEPTHMASSEDVSRRRFDTSCRLMAATFAAKATRPASFAKKTRAAESIEIARH